MNTIICSISGLEITAGQWTMSGQNWALSKQIRRWLDMLLSGFQRKFNFETIVMEIDSWNLIMFPKKILTRGTFVCEIDDISCCQSRPQIGYCCSCCKVLKIACPAAPKITCIASSANKSEKKKDPEWQYSELVWNSVWIGIHHKQHRQRPSSWSTMLKN